MTRKIWLLSGVVLLVLGLATWEFSGHASAQETPCMPLEIVIATLDAEESPHAMVPADQIPAFLEIVKSLIGGKVPEGITNVITATIGETKVFGLEIGGCVIGPIALPSSETLRFQSPALKMPKDKVGA